MISSSRPLCALDVEREKSLLLKALHHLIEEGRIVQVEWLETSNIARISNGAYDGGLSRLPFHRSWGI